MRSRCYIATKVVEVVRGIFVLLWKATKVKEKHEIIKLE